MNILKRSVLTAAAIGAAGAIAAGASAPAFAATTSGARYQEVKSVGVLGPNGTECGAIVLSAAVSDGAPAYVSAMVTNTLTSACTGFLQSSVNGGAWTDVSPQQSVPGGQGLNNPAWYKTANYYAGPGTSVRACVEVGTATTATCSSGVSVAASSGTPASDATSVFYAQKQQTVNIANGSGECSAYLNSSTTSKAAASQVSMILQGNQPAACTGWIESSTDNGSTWEQATPTYSLGNFIFTEWAFTPSVADGTGQLARACVQGTGAKVCTATW